jgi:hypothetical protein
MMLRTLGIEALLGRALIKGFEVPSLDGSPFPLGSTATNKTTGVFKTLWGVGFPLTATGKS